MTRSLVSLKPTTFGGRMERWSWDGRQGMGSWRASGVTVGHFLIGEGEPLKGCKQGSALIRFDFRNIILVGEVMARELWDWGQLGGYCNNAGKKERGSELVAVGWRGGDNLLHVEETSPSDWMQWGRQVVGKEGEESKRILMCFWIGTLETLYYGTLWTCTRHRH